MEFGMSGPMDGEQLAKFMRKILGKDTPTSNDPGKYPRSALITDDKVLLLIAESSLLEKDYMEAQRLEQELLAKLEVTKNEIFRRLQDLHPEVFRDPLEGNMVGYRKWKGRTYYVGWDSGEEE